MIMSTTNSIMQPLSSRVYEVGNALGDQVMTDIDKANELEEDQKQEEIDEPMNDVQGPKDKDMVYKTICLRNHFKLCKTICLNYHMISLYKIGFPSNHIIKLCKIILNN